MKIYIFGLSCTHSGFKLQSISMTLRTMLCKECGVWEAPSKNNNKKENVTKKKNTIHTTQQFRKKMREVHCTAQFNQVIYRNVRMMRDVSCSMAFRLNFDFIPFSSFTMYADFIHNNVDIFPMLLLP